MSNRLCHHCCKPLPMAWQSEFCVACRPIRIEPTPEIDEHAIRFLQAQRDFPSVAHKGTEPAILTTQKARERMEFIKRDFRRSA